jgi:integrase
VVDYRGVLLGGAQRREKSKDARSLVLMDRCGHRPIAALDDAYWQSLVDELVSDGKSCSRIATYPLSRRFGVSDSRIGKLRRGELYKSPGSRRSVVASDRPGWALAFYTGMRRGEIGRSEWQHEFWGADEIIVAASKSDAGEGRRVPPTTSSRSRSIWVTRTWSRPVARSRICRPARNDRPPEARRVPRLRGWGPLRPEIWTGLSFALSFVGVRGPPKQHARKPQEHCGQQELPEKPGME